jgi:aspartate/methionine/tyrosine aminotransferase
LNTPHNPTGKVFSYSELKEIVDLCIENDVYIITDEIYEHMTYHDKKNNHQFKHIFIPEAFPDAVDRTLVCNSLGKSASATGWRLGWCLHPPHLSDLYRGVHDQLVAMSPHPQQFASLAFFTLPDAYFKNELHTRYQMRLSILTEALKQVGFGVVPPEGAYYLFVDYRGVEQLSYLSPMDAAMYLMKEVGVAVVPGDNFYGKSQDGQHFLRFAACRSMSDITAAVLKLQAKLNKSE